MTTTTSQQVVGMMAIYETFSASVRSVGTACTLAGVGVYLHRRQFILGDGKRTLALISQQVTIPLLFFTKIIYCNQNWSDEPCPDITTSLQDVWILLLWPLYVVGIGALVGYAMAVVSKTPMHQRRAVLAACMFGNSTGLPITLLTVVHSNFPSDTDLGRIDPCLFLSVYLLLFPVLQWGIGGWLLAPPPSSDDDDNDAKDNVDKESDEAHPSSTQAAAASASGEHQGDYNHHYYTNVLNKPTSKKYEWKHRGMEETDASMYMSVPDHLNRLSFHSYYQGAYTYDTNSSPPTSAESITDHQDAGVPITTTTAIDDNNLSQPPVSNNNNTNMMMLHHTPSSASIGMDISRENSYVQLQQQQQQQHHQEEPQTQFMGETTKLLTNHHDDNNNHNNDSIMISSSKQQQQHYNGDPKQQEEKDGRKNDDNVVGTGTIVAKIFKRCLQPPVMGALAGIVVASFPLVRGIFVDLIDRNGSAPMQWMFDALYQVGQAAVPLNMMILGCNLSASYYSNNNNNNNNGTTTKTPSSSAELFSLETTLSIVMGKMLIMPMIGFVSAYVFRYGWDTNITTIPEEIAGSFYLVLMIVFLTPTANNVMVMVELSSPSTSSSSSSSSSLGKKSNKEAIARVIAWQYALSPLLLSVTMTAAVGIAVQWS